MSSNFTSSSTSYSYSSSSQTGNGAPQVQGQRSAQQTYTDASGQTHVRSAQQSLGEPVVTDTRSYDSQGRQLADAGNGAGRIAGGSGPRIQDVTDEDQAAKDRLYEERMEEEYAKREGGA